MIIDGELVAFDLETSGLEFSRPDFRIISCAFSWKSDGKFQHVFCESEDKVKSYLERLIARGAKLLVHNAQFEMGCCSARFGIFLPVYADTMRLVQHLGGIERKDEKRAAYSLEKSTERILGIKDYKRPYHKWIIENVPEAKGSKRPGAFISQLPAPLLAEYNCKDTEYTYRLYEVITEKFHHEGFKWRFDMENIMPVVALVTQAKLHGIAVNTDQLENYIPDIDQEVEEIDARFYAAHKEHIDAILDDKFRSSREKYKTERGRANCKRPVFNAGSNDQLADLYVGRLGMAPVFQTDKGRPSFKTAHLPTWGETANILAKRRKRLKVQQFCKSLLEKASFDGRWHHDLRVFGTSTFRMAGGGGCNVQGLNRSDKRLMSALLADEGQVFVSTDLSSGEPCVTSHYSQDPNYTYMVFGGVGLAPHWRDGVLFLDDPYISGMSINPALKPKLLEAWKRDWNDGMDFAQQWLADSDVIKKWLKRERTLSKRCILAINYGMGKMKLHKITQEEGFTVTEEECAEFRSNYWRLYNRIKRFGKRLSDEVEDKGFIVNQFGLRLTPEPHKAYNAYIQSSINPIINFFTAEALKLATYAQFVVCIHDETIFSIPEGQVEHFRKACAAATAALNTNLKWSLNIRTGFVTGANLFDAK